MSNSVDSVVDGALHRTSTRSAATAGHNGASKADAAAPEAATDLLNLTGRAKKMQALEHDLAKSPEFDAARVSELKDAIASGQYEINAERIADRLLTMEAKLP
ncbi:MAG: negative regulator of flagellin synthesis FlgM [Gammaproteobacteria bacterium]|jgi:negative regulator of flagellin synthesis FlgM